jgi:hypothetical protein
MVHSWKVHVLGSDGTELIAQFATRIKGELTLRTKVRLHVEFDWELYMSSALWTTSLDK